MGRRMLAVRIINTSRGLLKKVRHFPCGATAVSRLVGDFRLRYRCRPAMMQELSQFE
ncbi:hypothetical protein [Odoribacter laneus]|uniref:hypothetical protein n=1 Tax=Odoribacter laneus TaxID=626933 RepID=UPI000AAA17A2|nr:hypothetical protein [Odoribacter laneus]